MTHHSSLARSSLMAVVGLRRLMATDNADRLRQAILASRGGLISSPESRRVAEHRTRRKKRGSGKIGVDASLAIGWVPAEEHAARATARYRVAPRVGECERTERPGRKGAATSPAPARRNVARPAPRTASL
jgi:hypothetical protein